MMETTTRSLYFYGNPNSLRSCLAHGSLVCDAYLGRHAHEKTLGNLAENALFLTHLKLNPERMAWGLPEGSNLYPVILEIKVLADAGFAMPARLLGADGSMTEGDLVNYNPANHLGAFVPGELPFSMVEGYLFLTERDKTSFQDPSPNLWYPEALFRALNDKERKQFKDSMNLEDIRRQAAVLDEALAVKAPANTLVRPLGLREKHRAVALRLALTAAAPLGETRVNLDALIARLFNIQLAQVKVKGKPLSLPEMRQSDADLEKVLGFEMEGAKPTDHFNFKVLDQVYQAFLNTPRGAWPDARALWAEVMGMALAEGVPGQSRDEGARFREALENAQRFFGGAMDVPLREVLAGIPADLPALSGLVMVLKNYDESRIQHFDDELGMFRLPRAARRYAWVYYAALNGLNPFDGIRKDNLWLNRFCDAYAAAKAPHPDLAGGAYTFEQYKGMVGKRLGKANIPGNPASYPLDIRPLVEPEDLRRRLQADLARPLEGAQAFETLQSQFKTLAKSYTAYEYHIAARHRLQSGPEGDAILRFTKAPEQVEVFDAKAFIGDWLANLTAFEAKFKSAKDRKVLMALYHQLYGELA